MTQAPCFVVAREPNSRIFCLSESLHADSADMHVGQSRRTADM
jgi:hypothetical protein